MRTPVPDYLHDIMESCVDDGEVASYIPELANANPNTFGIALCMDDGTVYEVGDYQHEFSLQSAAKPFAYALAVEHLGPDGVEEHVGVEPSGDAFNSASVDAKTGKPSNPMINIGAITTYALTGPISLTPEERFDNVRLGMSRFAGRELEPDIPVYESEMANAWRNLSLAYLVRSTGHFTLPPHDVVDGYTKVCSLRVTPHDLAVMGMTLGNGGINPVTEERVVSEDTAQRVLSVMSTCGMYDASGDWMTDVGIPAKSGVSGGIVGVLPGQASLATFSPRLDRYGNSVRGLQAFTRLSQDLGLHIMSLPPTGESTVRSVARRDQGDGPELHVEIQGPLRFSSAERVMRTLAALPVSDEPVVLDVSRVGSADRISVRMIHESMYRLHTDGHQVMVRDPNGVLRDRWDYNWDE